MLITGLMLMASNVGCTEFSNGMPDNLIFEYRKELRIVKEGDCITITRSPVNSSAQKSPSLKYDKSPRTVLIKESDFIKIWQQLSTIDFERLNNLDGSDFIQTPPDKSHTETLRLVIDGKKIVDWARSYKILVEPLRNPLVETNNLMRGIYENHLAEPVIPDNVFLKVTRKDADKPEKYVLSRDARSIKLEYHENDLNDTGIIVSLSRDEFDVLWADLVRFNLFNLPLHMTVPVEPGARLEPVYGMLLVIESTELVSFSVAPGFAGLSVFEAICDKLESLWKSKR